MEVSGQLYALATLPPWQNLGTHWIGGWVGPRASLDVLEKIKISSQQGLKLGIVHLIVIDPPQWNKFSLSHVHHHCIPKRPFIDRFLHVPHVLVTFWLPEKFFNYFHYFSEAPLLCSTRVCFSFDWVIVPECNVHGHSCVRVIWYPQIQSSWGRQLQHLQVRKLFLYAAQPQELKKCTG